MTELPAIIIDDNDVHNDFIPSAIYTPVFTINDAAWICDETQLDLDYDTIINDVDDELFCYSYE